MMDEKRIVALEAKVEKLDRLVYRLYKRLQNLEEKTGAEPVSDSKKDELAS